MLLMDSGSSVLAVAGEHCCRGLTYPLYKGAMEDYTIGDTYGSGWWNVRIPLREP